MLNRGGRQRDTPATHRIAPPDLGEHNRNILEELGYAKEEIDDLEAEGIFGKTTATQNA